MLSKFAIDYIPLPGINTTTATHRTDDPVEAEEFLMHLLNAGSKLLEIRHDGVKLSPHQSDMMLRVAAERNTSAVLQKFLGIDGVEVKHRFGFAP
ncbi:MAG: hypothetical protein JWM59_3067 [Verrucomicrobiales bacterium]|nr:hypothetical protein [Verrucomicrobiales bacterium]